MLKIVDSKGKPKFIVEDDDVAPRKLEDVEVEDGEMEGAEEAEDDIEDDLQDEED